MTSKFLDDATSPRTRGQKQRSERWPNEEEIERFKMNVNFHPSDARQHAYYHRLMQKAFAGRNVTVVDHEQIDSTIWVPGEIDSETNLRVREPRNIRRHFIRVELDAWQKEDDPTLTTWEKVKHWLLRRPQPTAEIPPRQIACYALSRMQFAVFCEAYDRGFK